MLSCQKYPIEDYQTSQSAVLIIILITCPNNREIDICCFGGGAIKPSELNILPSKLYSHRNVVARSPFKTINDHQC